MFGFKRIFSDFSTDYKIKSDRILGGGIFSTLLLVVAIFMANVFVGLKSSSSLIVLPFVALNTLLLIGYFLNFNRTILSISWVVAQYLTIEAHFLINPYSYHAIHFWLIFVPLCAILVNGVRQSQVWLGIVLLTIIGNAIYAHTIVGDLYPATIKINAFAVTSTLFIIGVYSTIFLLYTLLGDAYAKMRQKSVALEKLHQQTDKQKQQLEKYQNVLFKLSKDPDVTNGELGTVYEKLCRLAVENLEVTRVSIWSYESNPPSIQRKYLHELSGGSDKLIILEKNHYPGYFRALLTKNFIAAENARVHPETAEFKESYLIPLDVYSMLDCPITIDGQFMGVVCCEHQHQPRAWTPEDILFVQSLSDIIALASKTHQINRLLKKIRTQNHELIEKSREIATLNQELSSTNEELTTMNDSLELTVKGRTLELEQQNTQLTEYAFINSHLLRAPLARILGLSHLIALNKEAPTDPTIIAALIQSTDELDAITKRISELLYVGSNVSREEIKEIIDRNLPRK
jgi:hypothetical protein